MTDSESKVNGKWGESAERVKDAVEQIPPRLLTTFSKKPRLIVIRGLGRTKRTKFDIEGNTIYLKDLPWKRGQKRESATFTVGSLITLGPWFVKRPYLFLKKGASRCVDFQSDLDAPGFTKADAEKVFTGGLMQWWKNYKGTKQGNLLLLLIGGNLLIGLVILMALMG